jgi:hypothetical protein
MTSVTDRAYLDTASVARTLGISVRAVRRAVHRGTLPAARLSDTGPLLVPAAALENLAAAPERAVEAEATPAGNEAGRNTTRGGGRMTLNPSTTAALSHPTREVP